MKQTSASRSPPAPYSVRVAPGRPVDLQRAQEYTLHARWAQRREGSGRYARRGSRTTWLGGWVGGSAQPTTRRTARRRIVPECWITCSTRYPSDPAPSQPRMPVCSPLPSDTGTPTPMPALRIVSQWRRAARARHLESHPILWRTRLRMEVLTPGGNAARCAHRWTFQDSEPHRPWAARPRRGTVRFFPHSSSLSFSRGITGTDLSVHRSFVLVSDMSSAVRQWKSAGAC